MSYALIITANTPFLAARKRYPGYFAFVKDIQWQGKNAVQVYPADNRLRICLIETNGIPRQEFPDPDDPEKSLPGEFLFILPNRDELHRFGIEEIRQQ